MAEINAVNGGNKRKKLDIDYDELLTSDSDNDFDDGPPELIITSSEKSYGGGPENELRTKTDDQLKDKIKKTKYHILVLGPKLPDKGDKLKLTLRRLEAECNRRNRNKVFT